MQMHNDNGKDRIANILNITPTIRENDLVIHQDTDNVGSEELDTDIKYVRDMMYDTIKNTSDAVEEMLGIAKQSQHPRAFEVVAILLKTMADLNNNVLDVHKKAKDTTSQKIEVKQTNNSVFVGSTTDLQNLLNKERSTEKVIDAEVLNSNESKQ